MTTGHNHRRPIPRANIGQRQNDVALTTPERAVRIAVSAAQGALITTRMGRMMAAAPSDRENCLIDKQSRNIGTLLAAIPADRLDPTRVIDEFLEWPAEFNTVMKFESAVLGIITALSVAKPSPPSRWAAVDPPLG